MSWQFKREETQKFSVIPEGPHRLRIKAAEKRKSKAGNDMLALQFEVSGRRQQLWHYITFLEDKPEITNRMLTNFFDSFCGIAEGDFVLSHWIGQYGAAVVKHGSYKGETTANVHYFLNEAQQAELKPWEEPKKKTKTTPTQPTTQAVPTGVTAPTQPTMQAQAVPTGFNPFEVQPGQEGIMY